MIKNLKAVPQGEPGSQHRRFKWFLLTLRVLFCMTLVLAWSQCLLAEPRHPENNPTFQKNHPRQTEVLKRVDKERKKINDDYRQGKITAQQRKQLLSEIHSVRKEDYADAKANNPNGTVRGKSYITRDQQRVMNQQENQINRELNQDIKK
jgi:hypothetical protein